ncbi:hypothetical protein COOONC_06081 [Cooperia oncophora]
MQEMRSWLAVVTILCFDSPGVTEKCDKHDSSESPGYKLASEMLRKSINFSFSRVLGVLTCDQLKSFVRNRKVQVDPCVDFFEFTCGNWIAAHPIPSDESYRTQAHVLSDKVRKQMRDALESPEIFASKSMNAPEVYIPQMYGPKGS